MGEARRLARSGRMTVKSLVGSDCLLCKIYRPSGEAESL